MSEPQSNPPTPPSGGPPPEFPEHEDAGTQALSEALRSSFFIIQIIMVLLVVVFLGSGFFTVKEQNKAIILRMGRPVGHGQDVLLLPGPHFAFPRPIDEVTNVPFTTVQQADSTVGWYKSGNEPDPPADRSIDPSSSLSYMMTADTNIIHLRGTATYRITQPVTFYFSFADAAGFVTNDLNNALLYAASRFTVDDILSLQPAVFRDAVETRLRELVEQQGLGITVDTVTFESKPPLYLAADFDKVVQANTDHDKTISEARSYESAVLGNARGDKEARIKSAESKTAGLVGLVRAEQTNFTRLLSDYESDPNLVTSLLQTEAMKKIVTTNALSTFVMPDMSDSTIWFQLGEKPPPLTLTTNSSGQ